jgi:RNA polymerase sigma factor (sigma-70 family)
MFWKRGMSGRFDRRESILNDSELVQGLRRQDPAAMKWLCDCHLPSLWRFVYTRVNGDQHLAEDITHETILAMLTTTQSECPRDVEILNVAGWLRAVAGRRIVDHFRAASRVQHLLPQTPRNRSDHTVADPAKQHELQETRAEVRQAMDRLPEQYRQALEWKYLDRLSVREIAIRWEITEKAVESILFRARREFRDEIARGQPPELSRNGKRTPPSDSTHDEPAKEDVSQRVT